MAPPSSSASRPGRLLAALVAVIVLLLLAIVGSNLGSPGKWSSNFHVLLGLDLTSGTQVALEAEAPHGKTVTSSEINQAVGIMLNRVDAGGFTEASVVPQGTNIINVAVPGQNSQGVVKLVEQTAELLFRQVLLEAPNTPSSTPLPTPAPTASPVPSGTPSASGSPSPNSSAKASPTASAAAFAPRGAGTAGGAVLTSSTHSLAGAAAAKPKATPTPTAPASPSATPSAAATPTPAATLPPGSTTPWQQAAGDPTKVSPQVKAEFNKLNCASKNWQQEIKYSPEVWNNAGRQIVACGNLSNVPGQNIPGKFVLDRAKVLGSQIHAASAALQQTSTFWQVNLSFNSAGAKAFGTLTTDMYNKYGKSQTPLDDLAVVLDGKVISFPAINQGPIVGGNAQITGNFDQTQATQLANVLSYGKLPLSFHLQSQETVSPQLGHDQLDAGLIAAGLGLIVVVIYLLFYYRGLAIVAVSSLVLAALLAYLSVIALGKYQHLALSLAGIAGLVVAIGITADSFVVFFERLRDEVREGGKSLRTAVEHGWVRARRTILVSDTVSFLAAALLYYFSIGDVRGFAFTLGLTTIIDVLVVFMFTKPMLTLLARTKFFGGGHPMSGLDPSRLGARAPWRGGPRTPARPARPATAAKSSATPKEA